ncbi:glycosyltransferase family 9 protein [Campylobacter sp. 19-13652]|uniref:glycosyltransferase family 9 protein n=1 Tax=Campylobacter sp. 19-13652 TaxID=2840180 RepID=UPI001C755882|nr:glycosyltransferase family 9 protein [Campylobacter sp. 19-13652]BCX80012.1 glycosyl transferase family 9 [Campylobacter sp. 19-13652]
MKILLIRNDNIGDLICSTPAIEALRKANPNAQIDIVVNSLNAPVMHKNPFVNNVLVYTKSKHVKGIFKKTLALFNKLKLLIKIRKEKYDAAVILRSGFSRHAGLWARAAGAKLCIGIKNSPSPVNHQIEIVKNIHERDICYALLAPLGAKDGGENSLLIPQNESDKFKDYVFFHAGSRLEKDQLSLEKAAAIAKGLAAEFKLIITAESAEFGKQVARLGGGEFLATKSLFELASYLNSARGFVVLDGGLMHAGAALRGGMLPLIVILGLANQIRWKPLGKNMQVLQPDSHVANDVSVDDVLKTARELFK